MDVMDGESCPSIDSNVPRYDVMSEPFDAEMFDAEQCLSSYPEELLTLTRAQYSINGFRGGAFTPYYRLPPGAQDGYQGQPEQGELDDIFAASQNLAEGRPECMTAISSTLLHAEMLPSDIPELSPSSPSVSDSEPRDSPTPDSPIIAAECPQKRSSPRLTMQIPRLQPLKKAMKEKIQCSFGCGETFTRADDHKRHQKTAHGMGTERFFCVYCEQAGQLQSYSRKDKVKSHWSNKHEKQGLPYEFRMEKREVTPPIHIDMTM